jgi:hypothetical protein
MAKAVIQTEFIGEDADLVAKNKRLQEELDKTTDRMRKMKADAKAAGLEGQNAFDQIRMGAEKMLGPLGVSLGAAGAIHGLVSILKEANAQARAFAEEAGRTAGSAQALAAIQRPGMEGLAVRQAAALGGRFGVKPGQAHGAVLALQRAYGGDLGAGLAAAKEVFQATEAGLPLEQALEVGTQRAHREAPETSMARAVWLQQYASPEAIAASARGVGKWKDQGAGWAAAAFLSSTMKDKQLRGEMGELGAYFNDPRGAGAGLWASLGVRGKGEMEKIQALAAIGGADESKLAARGVPESLRRELSLLAGNAGQVADMQRRMATEATGDYVMRRGAAVQNVPEVMYAKFMEDTQAQIEADRIASGAAASAQLQEMKKRFSIRYYQQHYGMQPIQGEKGYSMSLGAEIQEAQTHEASMAFEQSGMGAQFKKVADALKENTAATENNSNGGDETGKAVANVRTEGGTW